MGAPSFVALCEKLRQKYGERFAPPKILIDMAAAGDSFYGRVAGQTNRVA
jgi:3-hydroxyacyl-CoA dehydrogenase/enoyl-CoA hydratase/3-hydroxybutyryl-CoA epimerase